MFTMTWTFGPDTDDVILDALKKVFIYYISCSKTVPYLTHSIFKRITSVRSHHTTYSKLNFYWPMTQTINLICLRSDTVYLRFDEQSASVCRLPWNNKSENIEYAYDRFFWFFQSALILAFSTFFPFSIDTVILIIFVFLPLFSEHVWEVTVHRRGLAVEKNIVGTYHLCLTDKALRLSQTGSKTTQFGEQRMPYVEFLLTTIRR